MKRTPLFETHVSLGARMAPFAGWEMPIQYTGILAEARAVRSRAGLFDVSHMGRVDIRGLRAVSFLNRVFSTDVTDMEVGRARYGLVCTEEGGIIDDCILYRREQARFLLVANAANSTPVLEWLSRWARQEIEMANITADLAMIALQGPEAVRILSDLTGPDVSSIKPFHTIDTAVAGVETFVARTGYTGEDGYELILPNEGAVAAWDLLSQKGAAPCGLGARDVLRLEAGLLLHGNDMDISTSPYEAGLDRFVDPDRDGYVASDALRLVAEQGVSRVLVGFNMIGRGVARQGHPIMDGSRRIGHVTSGSYSPTLDRNIGLGYVPTGFSSPGSSFQVDVRGWPVEAEVVTLPFYSRKRSP